MAYSRAKTRNYYINWAIEMRIVASEAKDEASFKQLMAMADKYDKIAERLAELEQVRSVKIKVEPGEQC